MKKPIEIFGDFADNLFVLTDRAYKLPRATRGIKGTYHLELLF